MESLVELTLEGSSLGYNEAPLANCLLFLRAWLDSCQVKTLEEQGKHNGWRDQRPLCGSATPYAQHALWNGPKSRALFGVRVAG